MRREQSFSSRLDRIRILVIALEMMSHNGTGSGSVRLSNAVTDKVINGG